LLHKRDVFAWSKVIFKAKRGRAIFAKVNVINKWGIAKEPQIAFEVFLGLSGSTRRGSDLLFLIDFIEVIPQ
jgi:hypothetical protein